ncbi:hypothetical protein HDU97_008990, partial [Phlyctochytrium planicorne]
MSSLAMPPRKRGRPRKEEVLKRLMLEQEAELTKERDSGKRLRTKSSKRKGYGVGSSKGRRRNDSWDEESYSEDESEDVWDEDGRGSSHTPFSESRGLRPGGRGFQEADPYDG